MKDIKPGSWIKVGKSISAVVCGRTTENENTIEVVYLDSSNKAINEEVIYKNGSWEFCNGIPSGGYADKIPRLEKYVTILRQGQNIK